MNILDYYSKEELENFSGQNVDKWPEQLVQLVHKWIAYELLDSWLEIVDDDEYDDRMFDVIEECQEHYE